MKDKKYEVRIYTNQIYICDVCERKGSGAIVHCPVCGDVCGHCEYESRQEWYNKIIGHSKYNHILASVKDEYTISRGFRRRTNPDNYRRLCYCCLVKLVNGENAGFSKEIIDWFKQYKKVIDLCGDFAIIIGKNIRRLGSAMGRLKKVTLLVDKVIVKEVKSSDDFDNGVYCIEVDSVVNPISNLETCIVCDIKGCLTRKEILMEGVE